jgi:predicted nucleic acid-binding protein
MSYLLDTNIISELRRKKPNKGVLNWFEKKPASTLFLSVLTLGELRKGIESLTDKTKRVALIDWLESDLKTFFSGRVLPIDEKVTDKWGKLLANAGRPLPAIDSLIGSTAAIHEMTLVTRNTKDFIHLGIDVVNPWDLNE